MNDLDARIASAIGKASATPPPYSSNLEEALRLLRYVRLRCFNEDYASIELVVYGDLSGHIIMEDFQEVFDALLTKGAKAIATCVMRYLESKIEVEEPILEDSDGP